DKTGIEVTVCHAYLANAFENLCGLHAENKHLPFLFQELQPRLQRIILTAIHKGDGTSYLANKSNKVHKSITTVSKILSEQIVDILLRLNFFPSLSISKEKIDTKGVHHQEAYTAFWSEEAKPKYNLVYRTRDGFRYWLLPIEAVNSSPYRGKVYNLTVEDDHSYLASHFAVSNCGKGGDVYTFLMEYENMEFPEALRVLAKKTGVELAESQWQTQTGFKKERIYKINQLALDFYHYILTNHNAGKKALSYLVNARKINDKIIETFGLGFAPSTGNALAAYLTDKKHFKPGDIVEAGLGFFRNGGINDFFQNRIIFPLFDHRGNVTGFSGRVLEEGAIKSKYINTRETLVYHKGKAFFGLNIAKEAIKKEKRAIIVEGEFDVLSLFREGIANAVAVKGTALTEDHLRLIGRFTDRISICFDQDKAGQEAMLRSIPALEESGLISSVIELPEKDPDELSREDPLLLKSALRNDKALYDFLIEKALGAFDKKTYEGKKKIADQVLPFLGAIDNEIIKEHYLKRLSEELSVSYESVVKEEEKIKNKGKDSAVFTGKTLSPKSREERLEEYLLSIIFQSDNPKQVFDKTEEILSRFNFITPSLQGIREVLNSYFQKSGIFDVKKIAQILPREYLPAFDTCLLKPQMDYLRDRYLAEAVKIAADLRLIYIKQAIKILGEKIKTKEKNQEAQEVKILHDQLSNLISLLHESK
ncbi:DNA primase, partial [Patescibacteria group bacterium]|nr:DNA primase [Patescibacteria group bacterium]